MTSFSSASFLLSLLFAHHLEKILLIMYSPQNVIFSKENTGSMVLSMNFDIDFSITRIT